MNLTKELLLSLKEEKKKGLRDAAITSLSVSPHMLKLGMKFMGMTSHPNFPHGLPVEPYRQGMYTLK